MSTDWHASLLLLRIKWTVRKDRSTLPEYDQVAIYLHVSLIRFLFLGSISSVLTIGSQDRRFYVPDQKFSCVISLISHSWPLL